MSQHHLRTRAHGGVCRHCAHDLVVRGRVGQPGDGRVWCSNTACRSFRAPYKMTSKLND